MLSQRMGKANEKWGALGNSRSWGPPCVAPSPLIGSPSLLPPHQPRPRPQRAQGSFLDPVLSLFSPSPPTRGNSTTTPAPALSVCFSVPPYNLALTPDPKVQTLSPHRRPLLVFSRHCKLAHPVSFALLPSAQDRIPDSLPRHTPYRDTRNMGSESALHTPLP